MCHFNITGIVNLPCGNAHWSESANFLRNDVFIALLCQGRCYGLNTEFLPQICTLSTWSQLVVPLWEGLGALGCQAGTEEVSHQRLDRKESFFPSTTRALGTMLRVPSLQVKYLRLLNHLSRSALECWSLYKRSHEVCIPFCLNFLPQNHICEILSCYCSSWSNNNLLCFYFLCSIWLEKNHIKYSFYCW